MKKEEKRNQKRFVWIIRLYEVSVHLSLMKRKHKHLFMRRRTITQIIEEVKIYVCLTIPKWNSMGHFELIRLRMCISNIEHRPFVWSYGHHFLCINGIRKLTMHNLNAFKQFQLDLNWSHIGHSTAQDQHIHAYEMNIPSRAQDSNGVWQPTSLVLPLHPVYSPRAYRQTKTRQNYSRRHGK